MKRSLEKMIKNISPDNVSICQKSDQTMIHIEQGDIRPDIIFMDIKLDEKTGIELADEILQIHPMTQIIFISGYDDYYLRAYDVEHVYFLKKPISEELLQRAYNRARRRIVQQHSERFVFSVKRNRHAVHYQDILYFENNGRKITLHGTNDVKNEFYEKMEDLTKRLPSEFIRCHNSYIVNLNKVDIKRKEEFIVGETAIPISRKYAKATEEAFMQRIGSIMSDDL